MLRDGDETPLDFYLQDIADHFCCDIGPYLS